MLAENCPRNRGNSNGPDWLYAGWFLHVLHLTYPDALPTYESGSDHMSMYGREDHIPMPPPGCAVDARRDDRIGQGEDALA